jgi:hypothetical protein
MVAFLADAISTADLPSAMTRARIGWGDYIRGRRDDPAFELACQEIDLVVRHALMIQLESRAAQGDYRAAKLLAGGLKEIAAMLRGQGVRSIGSEDRPGDDAFPGRVHEGIRHPEGPCLECMGGLIVHLPVAVGSSQTVEVVVRNREAEFWRIPMPKGWENAPLVYGTHVDPAKLVLNPEGTPDDDGSD